MEYHRKLPGGSGTGEDFESGQDVSGEGWGRVRTESGMKAGIPEAHVSHGIEALDRAGQQLNTSLRCRMKMGGNLETQLPVASLDPETCPSSARLPIPARGKKGVQVEKKGGDGAPSLSPGP